MRPRPFGGHGLACVDLQGCAVNVHGLVQGIQPRLSTRAVAEGLQCNAEAVLGLGPDDGPAFARGVGQALIAQDNDGLAQLV